MSDNPVGRPANPLIDPLKLAQLRRDGVSVVKCAEYFGVSISAVKRAQARLQRAVVVSPTKEQVEEIDSFTQLAHTNAQIMEQLKRCNKLIVREETKMQALDELQRRIDENPHDVDAQEIMDRIWNANVKNVLNIQSNLINASAEIRKHIELKLKITEALYNVQMIQEFQNEILEILRTVDKEIAMKIITKLKERKALRGLVKIA